jgi:lysozyme
MSDYLTILDLSRWQGKLDADKAKAAGAVGVILRATIGNYYTDPMFAENWKRANDAGLLVGGYHVFNPTNSAISQIQRFIDVIGARVPDFPHTIDVELHAGQNQYTITTNLKACMPYVPRVRGKLPTIYTAKWYWDQYILPSTDWSIYPLHVAHYTTSLVPLLPRDWKDWYLHQYSADGNFKGSTYGVESAHVDLNRYRGSLADLRKFCGLTDTQPIPAPPAPTSITVTANPYLNIRAYPSTEAAILGSARPGSVWQVVDDCTDANSKRWYCVKGWVYGDYVK